MSVSTVVSFYNKKGDDMSMIKWRPFEELENFDTESQNQGFDLAVDMYEDDNNVIAAMNVPGVAADNIKVRVDDNHLHISGERKQKEEVKEKNYYHKEIRYGSFERTVSLPCAVNASSMTKKLENGVLTIMLPKE